MQSPNYPNEFHQPYSCTISTFYKPVYFVDLRLNAQDTLLFNDFVYNSSHSQPSQGQLVPQSVWNAPSESSSSFQMCALNAMKLGCFTGGAGDLSLILSFQTATVLHVFERRRMEILMLIDTTLLPACPKLFPNNIYGVFMDISECKLVEKNNQGLLSRWLPVALMQGCAAGIYSI